MSLDLATARSTLRSVLGALAGIPVDSTGQVWLFPAVDGQTPQANIDVSITSVVNLGRAAMSGSYDPEAQPQGDLFPGMLGSHVETIATNVELTCTVKITCELQGDSDTALNIAQAIRRKLEHTSVADTLRQAGLGYVEARPVRDISFSSDGRIVSCYAFEIVLSAVDGNDDAHTTIEVVNVAAA